MEGHKDARRAATRWWTRREPLRRRHGLGFDGDGADRTTRLDPDPVVGHHRCRQRCGREDGMSVERSRIRFLAGAAALVIGAAWGRRFDAAAEPLPRVTVYRSPT
jgi:hypothetical protein